MFCRIEHVLYSSSAGLYEVFWIIKKSSTDKIDSASFLLLLHFHS